MQWEEVIRRANKIGRIPTEGKHGSNRRLSTVNGSYPLRGGHHLAEAHLLRDQDRVMKLLGRDRSGFVADVERSVSVGEELDVKAEMKRLAGGGVAAHLRHVTGDGDSFNVVIAQPFLKVGSGETARKMLVDERGARANGDFGTKLPFEAATAENGAVGLRRSVLDDDDGNARDLGGVHGVEDVRQGVRGIGDGQLADEVFVLDVDDQQTAGHGEKLSRGERWWRRVDDPSLKGEDAHHEQEQGPQQPSQGESDDVGVESGVGLERHKADGEEDGGEQDADPAGDASGAARRAFGEDAELAVEPASDEVPEHEDERHGAEQAAHVGAEMEDLGEERAKHGGGNVDGDGDGPRDRHDKSGLRMAFGKLAFMVGGLLELGADGVSDLDGTDGDERDEQDDVSDGQNAPEAESAEHGGIVLNGRSGIFDGYYLVMGLPHPLDLANQWFTSLSLTKSLQ